MSTDLPFKDVLIVTQYYKPEPGAPQIRLSNMARRLKEKGVNVRVLTGMPNYPTGKIHDGYRGKLTSTEEIEGIPLRRVWLYPAAGRGAVRRLANYISFTLMVFPVMLFTKRPDLIFIEAQPLTLAFPAWIVKLLRGVPYVYNTPDLQVEVAAEAGWGVSWLIGMARALEGFLMKQSLTVTTVTHAFIEHFIENRNVPKEKMSFLPNGADTERLRPLPRDEEYAKEMGVGDRTVFTYAGTHAHYQGLEVIIDAAKQLQDRKDIAILMVGKGPVRQELIDMAKDAKLENVVFQQSPFEDMHRLMSLTHASLVVLRNIPAALKMRLSKAIPPLASGVPVIYAGPGETAAIIEREGCGMRVEPENPRLLAEAIRSLADDAERQKEMGRIGRELAEREFSWKAIVDDWFRQLGLIKAGQDPQVPAPS